MPPILDLAHNPGTCPDRDLNQRSFTLWDNAQTTKPCWLGSELNYFYDISQLLNQAEPQFIDI